MLVLFTNVNHMKSKVRYLALFCLFSVIDSFEWFCMESLHNSIQLMLVFLKGSFLVLHFSNYVKMDVSFLEEKPSFKMLVLSFSSKLDWSSQIVYIARTTSKKIVALICSMKCLSPKFAFYLYKSVIQPCM